MTKTIVCSGLVILLVITFPGLMQAGLIGSGAGSGRELDTDTPDSETGDQGGPLEWERCTAGGPRCFERPLRQMEAVPFWANRGKREPMNRRERFYADEPQWLLGRRNGGSSSYGTDDDLAYLYGFDPFFPTRGKKQMERRSHPPNMRDRRDPGIAEETPFFAARGKRGDNTFV